MAVGEHVQLVARVSLGLLLSLRDGSLVARCKLDVYFDVLPWTMREERDTIIFPESSDISFPVGHNAVFKGDYMTSTTGGLLVMAEG